MNQNITTIKYPARSQWQQLMTRAVLNTDELQTVVGDIVAEVKSRGDEALRDYARRFDGVELADLRVSDDEIAEAAQLVSDELKQAIATAAANIERFHAAQAMSLWWWKLCRACVASSVQWQSRMWGCISPEALRRCFQRC